MLPHMIYYTQPQTSAAQMKHPRYVILGIKPPISTQICCPPRHLQYREAPSPSKVSFRGGGQGIIGCKPGSIWGPKKSTLAEVQMLKNGQCDDGNWSQLKASKKPKEFIRNLFLHLMKNPGHGGGYCLLIYPKIYRGIYRARADRCLVGEVHFFLVNSDTLRNALGFQFVVKKREVSVSQG